MHQLHGIGKISSSSETSTHAPTLSRFGNPKATSRAGPVASSCQRAFLRHLMVIENYVSISALFFIEFNLHLGAESRRLRSALEFSSLSPQFAFVHTALTASRITHIKWIFFCAAQTFSPWLPLCNVQLPSSDIVVVVAFSALRD